MYLLTKLFHVLLQSVLFFYGTSEARHFEFKVLFSVFNPLVMIFKISYWLLVTDFTLEVRMGYLLLKTRKLICDIVELCSDWLSFGLLNFKPKIIKFIQSNISFRNLSSVCQHIESVLFNLFVDWLHLFINQLSHSGLEKEEIVRVHS